MVMVIVIVIVVVVVMMMIMDITIYIVDRLLEFYILATSMVISGWLL